MIMTLSVAWLFFIAGLAFLMHAAKHGGAMPAIAGVFFIAWAIEVLRQGLR